MKRRTMLWILVSIIVVSCANRAPGQIALSMVDFDFGTVPNTKAVSQTFEIRNVGRGTLEITGVSTSCGCTTAKVTDSFVPPGENTELIVTYDPQAHGGATGRFMRVVYIRSNDADTPEAQLTIFVNVTEQ